MELSDSRNELPLDVGYYDNRWDIEDKRKKAPNHKRVKLVAERVVSAVQKLERSRILDVGCGNGWILEELEGRLSDSNMLFGIEPSEDGAANASSRCTRSSIATGLLGDHDFGEKFDVVICSEVIEHVDNQEQFMGLLGEHLNPGGTLVMTTPNGRYLGCYFQQLEVSPQPIENWLTDEQLLGMLKSHFFDVRLTTFDNSFWEFQHSRLSAGLRSLWKLKGGYRLFKWIEGIQLSRLHSGLYLLAEAKAVHN